MPKRLFKRAVDRNLLKRRIREAYRLNKRTLYKLLQDEELRLILVIQYKGREIVEFHAIEEALLKGMKILAKKLTDNGPPA